MDDIKKICLYDSFEEILEELQRRFDDGIIPEIVVDDILNSYIEDIISFRAKNKLFESED